MQVKPGDTNVTTYFAMRLTADGKAATGLTPSDFDLQYVRSGAVPVAKVDMVALAATNTAHTDNRGIEIDATDQPALYRVDWPDAAFATGVREVVLSVKVATAFTEHLRVELEGPMDAIWDEVLTGGTHNVTNSAGRRLRQIQEAGGYTNGFVYIDTVNGTAGTTNFENGVDIKDVDSIGDANTIATSIGLSRFNIAPGSSITLAATQQNQEFVGLGWTLALGGRDTAGTHFSGADVSGTCTGASETHFDHCEVGTVTCGLAHFDDCDLTGTITLTAAGTYFFDHCSHAGTAVIDFGSSVGNTTVHIHDYHGALTIKNMGQTGTDVLHFSSSNGKLTLDNTNTGGTKNLNGTFDISDSSTGQTTNDAGAILTRVPAALSGGNMKSDVVAIGGSSTSADKLEEGAEALVIGEVNDASASTTVFVIQVTGDTISSVNDFYNGRIITFTSGNLLQQATDITAYNGTTKAVTVTALTAAPDDNSQIVIS